MTEKQDKANVVPLRNGSTDPASDGEIRHEIIIRVMEDGLVRVTGPLDDKMLCYGILGVAQEVIKEYVAYHAKR